jgi:hypothetical protein
MPPEKTDGDIRGRGPIRSYMRPEQAEASGLDVDTRTDIYWN